MQDGSVNPKEKKADGLRLFSVDAEPTSTDGGAAHVGARLRAARMARGRTIDDCASDLKIRADYLRALEDLDFDRLPSMAYAGPFARSYAKALGLDELAVLQEVREHAPRPKTEEAFTPPAGFAPRPARSLYLGLAFALTLAVGAGWMITYDRARDAEPTALQSVSVERPTDVEAPASAPLDEVAIAAEPADAPEDSSVAADATVAAGEELLADSVSAPPPVSTSVESGAVAADSQEPVSLDPADADRVVAADSQVSSEPPRPRARPGRVASTSPASPQSSTAPTQPAAEAADAGAVPDLPNGRRFGATDAPAAVSIRALKPAWLRIEDGDGRVTFSGNLGVGDRFFAPYGRGYIATVRDAGAFDAFAGARYLGVLGREGQPLPTVEIDVLGNS